MPDLGASSKHTAASREDVTLSGELRRLKLNFLTFLNVKPQIDNGWYDTGVWQVKRFVGNSFSFGNFKPVDCLKLVQLFGRGTNYTLSRRLQNHLQEIQNLQWFQITYKSKWTFRIIYVAFRNDQPRLRNAQGLLATTRFGPCNFDQISWEGAASLRHYFFEAAEELCHAVSIGCKAAVLLYYDII